LRPELQKKQSESGALWVMYEYLQGVKRVSIRTCHNERGNAQH
jgi:hypothetical protein